MPQVKLVRNAEIQWTKNRWHVNTWFRRLVTSDKLSSSLVRIEPGGGQIPYVNPGETEEVEYVLQGEGVALVNGEWQACVSGDCIDVEAGVEHGLKNPSSQPLLVLSTFHPPLPYGSK